MRIVLETVCNGFRFQTHENIILYLDVENELKSAVRIEYDEGQNMSIVQILKAVFKLLDVRFTLF